MMRTYSNLSLAAALLLGPTLGCGDDAAETTGATSASAGEGTEAQRVEVTVSADGYDPREVHAQVGKPLTLVFTRTSDQGCGDTLVIAAADIQRDLPLNQPVEVTFTPSAAGDVRFSCGMDMYDGKIMVH